MTHPAPAPAGGFANPPAVSRLFKIVHHPPEEPEAQEALLAQLVDLGFGGLVVNAWGPGYLAVDENLHRLAAFVERAKAAGLILWLYDERGYPSGTAGGLTLENYPLLEVHALQAGSQTTSGDRVAVPAPPGDFVASFAWPVDAVAKEHGPFALPVTLERGAFHATVPAGTWRCTVVTRSRLLEGYQTMQSGGWKVARPHPDLMNPEAVDRFLAVTHARYAEILGDDLGAHFFATFTDEPSTVAQSYPLRTYATLPWSPVLETLLAERYGLTLAAMLPAMISDPGPEGQLARYRYFEGVAELMARASSVAVQDWCNAHNWRSGGTCCWGAAAGAHSLYGDLFRCLRRMDVPGITFSRASPELPWYTARIVSSVAALTARPTRCPSHRRTSAGRAQAARAASRGDPRRAEPPDPRRHYQLQRLLSLRRAHPEETRALNAYVGRCVSQLTEGQRNAHVALLYPIETLWTRWVAEPTSIHSWYAIEGGAPAARRVEMAFHNTIDVLYANRIEFDIIDTRTVLDAEVGSGALQHAGMAWDTVLLPEVDTLPLPAWQQLAELTVSGGSVVAIGARPTNTDARFPAPEVAAMAEVLVYAHFTSATDPALEAWLQKHAGANLGVTQPTSPLRITHRITDDAEVLFVINDSPDAHTDTLTLPLRQPIEYLDPETGTITPLSGRTVTHTFAPYGAALFRSMLRPPVASSGG